MHTQETPAENVHSLTIKNEIRFNDLSSADIMVMSVAHFTSDGFVLMLPTLLPIIAGALGLSYVQIGIISGSTLVCNGIGQLIIGYYSDIVRKKNYLVTGGLLTAAISIFLVGLSDSFLMLEAIACLVGFTTCVYHPVGYSILSSLTTAENRGKAFGIHGASGCVGLLTFPFVAGVLTQYIGWRLAFESVASLGFIIGIAFFIVTRQKNDYAVATGNRLRLEFLSNNVLMIIAISALTSMAVSGFSAFLPVKLDLIGLSPSMIGLCISLFSGIGVVGQYFSGRLTGRLSIKAVVSVFLVLTSALILAFMSLPQTLMILVILSIGFCTSAIYVCNNIQFANNIPRENSGLSMGVYFFIAGVCSSLSPILMGYVSEMTEIDTGFLILPVFYLIALGLMLKTK